MGELTGKVAFITGAARGQGRAHAVKLAAAGADIIALDICADIESNEYPLATPDDLDETAKLIEKSGQRVVSAAVEYFVNSERAYVTMYRALEHYRSEGRTDLVAKYTTRLAAMVRNTSYSSVLERMKLT